MATVTAALVVLAFVSGCITAVAGVWVGHGESPLSLVLNWGAVTLVLQLFAACVAIFHARASREPGPAPDGIPAPVTGADSPANRT